MPNGEWTTMAMGVDSNECDEPGTATYRSSTARAQAWGSHRAAELGVSSNPNPPSPEREMWASPVTTRLAGWSLRNDNAGHTWEGQHGFYTVNAPLVAHDSWGKHK